MEHPSFGIVTFEALATGLLIAVIGILAYYLHTFVKRSDEDAHKGSFWGMAAALFFVGTLWGFITEYSGVNEKFCAFNYGRALRGASAPTA